MQATVDANRIGMTRRRLLSDLGKGIPAILLSLSVAAITATGLLRQRASGMAYWERGEQALRDKEYRTSQIYLQKALKGAGVDQRRIALALAQGYEQTGDIERASEIMSSLAPLTEAGLPEAHLFMAYRLVSRRSAGAKINLDELNWHIQHAQDRRDGSLPQLKAVYYAAIGDTRASLQATREAGEVIPEMLLRAVQMRAAEGEVDAAAHDLVRAQERLKARYEKTPDNPQFVISYAQSLLMSDDFKEAFRILRKANARDPAPIYNRVLADSSVLVASRIIARANMENRPVNTAVVTGLLLKALELDPQNSNAITAVASLSNDGLGDREAFRKELLRQIASGKASPQAFFVMGIFEWSAGRLEMAVDYTQQAVELAPNMFSAANNLAMFLIQKEPSETDRALELINSVLVQSERPQFYDTRAKIYTARKEYDAAITDYLRILSSAPNKPAVQQQLAELYELSGNPELAQEMREAAEQTNTVPVSQW